MLFHHFNRALEQRYRVAYWGQRGAGKSYDSDHPPSGMTVAQFVADLGVVVDHLRAMLNAKIVLVGHSWGSALALLYAHRQPRHLAGVIGIGQVANQAEQEAASYAFALAEAERRGNTRAIRELAAIGMPPLDVPALSVKNKWVEAFGGYFVPGFSKARLVASALWRRETSISEIRQLIAANEFSLRAMWPEVRELDLTKLVPEVEVPIAFFLGRQDRQCPPDFAVSYLDRLKTPEKTAVWFERSAHNVPFEQPSEFNAELVKYVDRWA